MINSIQRTWLQANFSRSTAYVMRRRTILRHMSKIMADTLTPHVYADAVSITRHGNSKASRLECILASVHSLTADECQERNKGHQNSKWQPTKSRKEMRTYTSYQGPGHLQNAQEGLESALTTSKVRPSKRTFKTTLSSIPILKYSQHPDLLPRSSIVD